MEDVETGSAPSTLSFTPHPSCPLEGMVSSQQTLRAGDHRPVHLPGAPRVQGQWGPSLVSLMGPGLRVTVRSITEAPAWLSVYSGNIHSNHMDTPTAGREPGRTLSSNL